MVKSRKGIETDMSLHLIEQTEYYPPLADLCYRFHPDGRLRKKPHMQPWGWVKCSECGAVIGKPLDQKRTKVLASARRCVLCGKS